MSRFSGSVPFRKIPIPVWVLVLCGTKRNRFNINHTALYILFTTPLPVTNYLHLNDINTNELIFLQNKSVLLRSKSYLLNLLPFYYT